MTAPLTSFYDRSTGKDGPVSGALSGLVVSFQTAPLTNTTYKHVIQLPTGAKFQVTHATVYCGTVTSDPSITIGSTAAGTQIVAAANLATGANQLTVKTYTASATGLISIQIADDTGDSMTLPCTVTLWGHMSQAPTSLRLR